jgi:hypothetical protein
LLACGLLLSGGALQAGPFIFAGEAYGTDLILHPTGYTGSGGQIELNVCLQPGTANQAAMEQSVRNIVAVYNQLLPTTGNIRFGIIPGSAVDFESVALHEVGHCLGKAHVNLASESGLSEANQDYTKSTDGGPPNQFNLGVGADGVRGSGDDVRGDDVNLHWFRMANNNPFTLDYATVDSTTYARDLADLPAGHLFAANGNRTVGASVLNTPNTEAVMQQGTYFGEIQRTLTPDGVATLRYAMSGLDEIAGTADDYTFHLNFIETTVGCDLKLQFSTDVGLAYCGVSGSSISGDHWEITSAEMYFGEEYTWFFNSATPCDRSLAIPQDQWTLFTLPCSVGISTGNTLADVLGDDLSGAYSVTWVVYERDAATDSYRKLAPNDTLHTGKGYWIYTTQAAQSINVVGQYNGSPDIPLRGAADGKANLVGHPFDFSVDWADVQVVDGAEVQSLAEAVADGDISETYHVANGNGYNAYDASTPGMIGTLNEFDGIWVKAFKDGIYLRVPFIAAASPAPDAATAAGESVAIQRSQTTDVSVWPVAREIEGDSWFVRLIVESGNYRDDGNVLGQLPDSVDGMDKHDLEELVPFGEHFLTIVFPHEEWESDAWGFTSDFHATSLRPQGEWVFAVHASSDVTHASLRLEGPAKILKKAKLRDLETGKLVKFSRGGYRFDLDGGPHYFSFKVRSK